MGVKTVKIDVNELTLGMFVAKLDRPWTQTPFPLQGFYIRDTDEIKDLRTHCNFVHIDVVKGDKPIATNLRAVEPRGVKAGRINKLGRNARKVASSVTVAALKIRRNVYTESVPLKKEIQQAQTLHKKRF